jgi:hypothetical protein
MSKASEKQEFYWHESAGARILIPSQLSIEQPFPELCAKTKKYLKSIFVTITSSERKRESAEGIIRQRLLGNSVITCELVREGNIHKPYRGIERIVQQHHKEIFCPGYYWRRIYYLDDAAGIIADIDAGGDGLFSDSEPMWQTVMDSFSWDPDQAVVLKMDGDEIAFRIKHEKKRKKRRVKPGSIPQLPQQIKYLQPFMDELMTYFSEEINEDIDTTLVAQLLEQRIQGMSNEDARKQIDEDYRIISEWTADDKGGRSAAGFISGFLMSFQIYGGIPEN